MAKPTIPAPTTATSEVLVTGRSYRRRRPPHSLDFKYLWDSAGHRFLFTGDTIYLRDGEWVSAVLESSDRGRYIESLELIRELDFDVLVPWAATGGCAHHALTDRTDARRRIDAILERVRRGEDH